MDFLKKQSFNVDIKAELEEARRADFLPYVCLTNEKVGDAPGKFIIQRGAFSMGIKRLW